MIPSNLIRTVEINEKENDRLLTLFHFFEVLLKGWVGGWVRVRAADGNSEGLLLTLTHPPTLTHTPKSCWLLIL